MAQWWYKKDDQQVGPFTDQEIRQLTEAGVISPETLLVRSDYHKASAKEVQELWATNPVVTTSNARPMPDDSNLTDDNTARAASGDSTEEPNNGYEIAQTELSLSARVWCGWPFALVFLGVFLGWRPFSSATLSGAIGGALAGAAYGINIAIHNSQLAGPIKAFLNACTGMVALSIWFATGLVVEPNDNSPQSQSHVLQSADGKWHVTVPVSWKPDEELRSQVPDAVIQASDRSRGLFFFVIAENEQDFAEMTLERYADLSLTLPQQGASPSEVTPPTRININGLSAIQTNFPLTVNGVNLVYLLTVLKSRQHYVRIVAWSLRSKYSENRTTIENIAHSFQEN